MVPFRIAAFQHGFQRPQIGLDHSGVFGELLVGHFWKLKQREHYFAALAIGHDSHRIQDRLAIRQRNNVIQNARIVCSSELNPYFTLLAKETVPLTFRFSGNPDEIGRKFGDLMDRGILVAFEPGEVKISGSNL